MRRPPESYIVALLSQLPPTVVRDEMRIVVAVGAESPRVYLLTCALLISATGLAVGAALAIFL